jgi:hypothetical protein
LAKQEIPIKVVFRKTWFCKGNLPAQLLNDFLYKKM